MRRYTFELRFPEGSDIEDRLDVLFDAGLDDSTFSVRCGIPHLICTRKAFRFWDAVGEAIGILREAGITDKIWVLADFER